MELTNEEKICLRKKYLYEGMGKEECEEFINLIEMNDDTCYKFI